MNNIPTYQTIIILLILSIFFEIIFESILKIRSSIQKCFKNKITYMTVSIISIFVISILIDNFMSHNRYYQFCNIILISLLIFLLDLSYFKKGR